MAGVFLLGVLFLVCFSFFFQKKISTKFDFFLYACAIFSLFGFFSLLELISDFGTLPILDPFFSGLAASFQEQGIHSFFVALAYLFDPWSMLLLSCFVVFFLWRKRYRSEAFLFAVTMLLDVLFLIVVKNLVQRVRPSDMFMPETGFSFPSGHAMSALVFFGLLCYLSSLYLASVGSKFLVSFVSVCIVLLVGFSRVSLRVHWLSDVLAGFFLGLFLLCSVLLVFRQQGK